MFSQPTLSTKALDERSIDDSTSMTSSTRAIRPAGSPRKSSCSVWTRSSLTASADRQDRRGRGPLRPWPSAPGRSGHRGRRGAGVGHERLGSERGIADRQRLAGPLHDHIAERRIGQVHLCGARQHEQLRSLVEVRSSGSSSSSPIRTSGGLVGGARSMFCSPATIVQWMAVDGSGSAAPPSGGRARRRPRRGGRHGAPRGPARPPVEAGSPGGRELLVQRGADQGVGEAVAGRARRSSTRSAVAASSRASSTSSSLMSSDAHDHVDARTGGPRRRQPTAARRASSDRR